MVDGGTALVQRRDSQNASDFAALAGARVVAEKIGGDTTNGTDANVQAAIDHSSLSTGAPITFGAPNGPQYVDTRGTKSGTLVQADDPGAAVGVSLDTTRNFSPYFLGIIGMNNWSATADATARGGYAAGGPPGTLFPVRHRRGVLQWQAAMLGSVSTRPAIRAIRST